MIQQTLTRMLLVAVAMSTTVSADEPVTLTPATAQLTSTPCDGGWRRWDGIGDIEGSIAYRERLTAIAAHDGELWVGTSLGRLLSYRDNQWMFQGTLQGVQITGIAHEGSDKVWLSTSDGIRRLERTEEQTWKVTDFREYYEGHPSFVSGGYIPGEDAVRLWGYVDGICVPRQVTTYAPFAISTEHGLFCWGNYGRVWHHFMPHYWGANSAWLDTRDLLPHRRPTCLVEDNDGHLWIGTQWDGIVRLNAHARQYHTRNPENNKKDGTEFSHIQGSEIGCPFDTVVDLAASTDHGIWASLTAADGGAWLARFNGHDWETFALEAPIHSVAELAPGIVLTGAAGDHSHGRGLRKVTWDGRKVEQLADMDDVIREIIRLPNGSVVAASWWTLYELDAAATEQLLGNSHSTPETSHDSSTAR